MGFLPKSQTTAIATHSNEDIVIRDKSLCNDLIGKLTFTEMIYFQILGRIPSNSQCRAIDACLITLMEHGLTPSALASRLVYSSAPESIQGALASGLSGVGSVFVGTIEGSAVLIDRLLKTKNEIGYEAELIASEFFKAGRPLPGFGHHMHKPDDPRTSCLFDLAEEHGISGSHVEAIKLLSNKVDEIFGKHITINATGAVAAVLGDCDVPVKIMRGFALISRAVGLVGHIHEEQNKPAMRAIWEASASAIPYATQIE